MAMRKLSGPLALDDAARRVMQRCEWFLVAFTARELDLKIKIAIMCGAINDCAICKMHGRYK